MHYDVLDQNGDVLESTDAWSIAWFHVDQYNGGRPGTGQARIRDNGEED